MSIHSVHIAGHQIIVHENDDSYDPVTGRALTGSWLWDSALFLAEWMAANCVGELTGACVLELGAGLGFAGLVAAALGAAHVVLTDAPPLLLGLRRNVAANGFGDRVEVRQLRWGSDEVEDLICVVGEVNVVVMSDVFFDPEEMEGLGRTMRTVWGERTRGWAASEVRNVTAECLEVLAAEGFRLEEEAVGNRRLIRSPEESAMFAVYVIRRNYSRLIRS